MKRLKRPQEQTVTPEVSAHIDALLARSNVGLEKRCARYRRGIKGVRYVAAFLFVIVTTTIYASAIYARDFSEFHTTTDSSASHVCEIIYGMTGKF